MPNQTTRINAQIHSILEEYETSDVDIGGGAAETMIHIDDAAHAMEKYGRAKKIMGAKSFARLVRQMRFTQQRYFDTRSEEALEQSKALEKQVDKSLEAILGR
jgi:uncharacterized protein YqgV (UPF0045/DUF77 family)